MRYIIFFGWQSPSWRRRRRRGDLVTERCANVARPWFQLNCSSFIFLFVFPFFIRRLEIQSTHTTSSWGGGGGGGGGGERGGRVAWVGRSRAVAIGPMGRRRPSFWKELRDGQKEREKESRCPPSRQTQAPTGFIRQAKALSFGLPPFIARRAPAATRCFRFLPHPANLLFISSIFPSIARVLCVVRSLKWCRQCVDDGFFICFSVNDDEYCV